MCFAAEAWHESLGFFMAGCCVLRLLQQAGNKLLFSNESFQEGRTWPGERKTLSCPLWLIQMRWSMNPIGELLGELQQRRWEQMLSCWQNQSHRNTSGRQRSSMVAVAWVQWDVGGFTVCTAAAYYCMLGFKKNEMCCVIYGLCVATEFCFYSANSARFPWCLCYALLILFLAETTVSGYS